MLFAFSRRDKIPKDVRTKIERLFRDRSALTAQRLQIQYALAGIAGRFLGRDYVRKG